MNSDRQLFWQQKLMALLHDAPDKCFDIANHESAAQKHQVVAGFNDEEYRRADEKGVKPADWFSSAAERFGFPKGKCAHNFKDDPCFIHPLSGKRYEFKPGFADKSGKYAEIIQSAIKGVPEGDWHTRFFLYWRRWLENTVASQEELAFLPADTRIPDHTIWSHTAITAALVPCITDGEVEPELLMFQLGPVQEFISQARSTRDLWSGSYLISWLMAHALKAISDEIGPDAVVFPSLRGNGIFDALHCEEFYQHEWKHGDAGEVQTTWERLKGDRGGKKKMADWLLTPTLPNRFLVIVPKGRGKELAVRAKSAIESELEAIGDAVWGWLEKQGASEEWRERWSVQLKAFPQVAWATQSWLPREECLRAAECLPKDEGDADGVAGRLRAILALAEGLPEEDKDGRYYKGGKLSSSGILWSAHYALLDAKLAARRNTRNFEQWGSSKFEANVKDSLSGKEECIGSDKFWGELVKKHKDIFTAPAHRYGVMNLIKRLWCHPKSGITYLAERLGLSAEQFNAAIRYDSTRHVAKRNIESGNPYIAVLSIDGDEMGKWISGAKTPALVIQLAKNAKRYIEAQGGGELHRLLTPSYHLQFSEALANFAMHKARDIVEKHKGDLIFAGGDDVLAILPSTRVIECAKALREAFCTDFEGHRIYPGSKSDLSCGIAVGHSDAPLQLLVKEAQGAERRAKRIYGRAAVAINVYKRSGEIIEWGCKWESGALELMERLTALTASDQLSGRFPYALAALLQPYALESTKASKLLELRAVIEREVEHVLSRQGAGLEKEDRKRLVEMISAWLESCLLSCESKDGESRPKTKDTGVAKTEPRPQDFINLFLVETFMNRMRGEA